ncbi:MAG: DNA polymerase III subunit epsilon [Defluviicoccus sp.]|nr:MAG: DNA polymerase III subunit epsilon [Defluviicoccus sp.]
MREVVLDTETTGLDPNTGHRIVEIGAIELLNHVATDKVFHCYLNPERGMPSEAFAVHGLSDAFLADKPRFAEVADTLASFLGDAALVIHNAAFDLGFLNAEFRRLGRKEMSLDRCIDTVALARRRYPGAPANLDALCRRFQIDLSDRALHGALKDAQLLAQVYLELRGGREPGLSLVSSKTRRLAGITAADWVPRVIQPSVDELAAHQAFVARFPSSLWPQPGSEAEDVPPEERTAAKSAG